MALKRHGYGFEKAWVWLGGMAKSRGMEKDQIALNITNKD